MKKIMTILGTLAIATTLAVGSGFAQQQADQKKATSVTTSKAGESGGEATKAVTSHKARHGSKKIGIHKHHKAVAKAEAKSAPAEVKKDVKSPAGIKSDTKAAPVTKEEKTTPAVGSTVEKSPPVAAVKDTSPAAGSKTVEKAAPVSGSTTSTGSTVKTGDKTAPAAPAGNDKTVQPKPAQ